MSPQRKEKLYGSEMLHIVADAAIAGPATNGALVPLLIIDTTERSDVEEVIRVSEFLPPGDVVIRWATVAGNSDIVALDLSFLRPFETRAIIPFSIEHQAILIDAALGGKAIYLQAGRPGDSFKADPNLPKLLVELHPTDFSDRWDKILLDRLAAVIRARTGRSRKECKVLAQQVVHELRAIKRFRLPASTGRPEGQDTTTPDAPTRD